MNEQDKATMREQLAEYAHDAWAGWMKHIFRKCDTRTAYFSNGEVTCIPAWAVERWQRQMNTPYADLPESEKESDRQEADRMLAIVAALTAQDAPQVAGVALPDSPGWWGYTGEREGVVHFTEFSIDGDIAHVRWAGDDFTMHYGLGWLRTHYRNIIFYRLHMPWDTPAVQQVEDGELKPCPFCGGRAEVAEIDLPLQPGYYAACNSCDAQMGDSDDAYRDASYAITAWNRRAPAGEVTT